MPAPQLCVTLFDQASNLVIRQAEALNSSLTIALNCEQEPEAKQAILRCAADLRELMTKIGGMGGVRAYHSTETK